MPMSAARPADEIRMRVYEVLAFARERTPPVHELRDRFHGKPNGFAHYAPSNMMAVTDACAKVHVSHCHQLGAFGFMRVFVTGHGMGWHGRR